MFIAGRIVRRVDARLMLICGAMTLVLAIAMLTGLTPQTGKKV